VSYWLWENDMVKEEVVREAQEVAVINSVLDLLHERPMEPGLAIEVEKSLRRSPDSSITSTSLS
jgi:hypothetical protein